MKIFLMKSAKYYLETLALVGEKNPTIVHRFVALLIQNIEDKQLIEYCLVAIFLNHIILI